MHNKYAYKVIWSEDDREFVGLCAEFPSLSFLSKSQDAAFKGIKHLVAEVIDDMKHSGEKIPEPLSSKKFSGKFVVRVPPDVHRKLTYEAMDAHISLNRYVSAKLAA